MKSPGSTGSGAFPTTVSFALIFGVVAPTNSSAIPIPNSEGV